MKRIWPKLALLAWLCSPASSWAGSSVAAGIRNCTWCHGTGAQGYTVAPRLAGQQALYIEAQLRGYAAHIRDNPLSKQYMWGAAANLRTDTVRDLADYFASLPPKSAHDGRWALAAKGQSIYLQGIPDANIVACLACHGPGGQGVREIPRLGGLSYFYLKRRLEEWGQGYHSAPASPMPLAASTLGPDEIEALASYLSFVR
ncbi:Cytochrome c553 [Bradyrhizobium erythrophlei]|jgi:cytochrome c553|nr:Cytochrome c553 [Bradyrhizobium erythrophlei]